MQLSRLFCLILTASATLISSATAPSMTNYSPAECQGSLIPYPEDRSINIYPDSLTPVYINHVSRHGARYPAGSAHTLGLMKLLQKADSLGTITPTGRNLKSLTQKVIDLSDGRWGALDSLGMAEHKGIASRMFKSYPELFKNATINAISSYSPRSMMSMFSFVHELDRLSSSLEINTSTGRKYSPLMRFFDVEESYIDFNKKGVWKPAYDAYMNATVPTSAIRRALGKDFPFEDERDARESALLEYYVLAGLSAMSLKADTRQFLTDEEFNALWSCFNLRQYLQRTATSVSSVPADIASDLLADMIATTDGFINGTNKSTANLRFGHAETLMPLFSLMRLPGCDYYTDDFANVSRHWRDFYVVPMASNLQMILFKSTGGRYYVEALLNETPISLIPGNDSVIIEWNVAKEYLSSRVKL